MGTALLDWKNEPRFCLDRSTVGGRASSGMIDESSTLGGGVWSPEADPCCVTGVTAVVGYGREDDALLSSAGRMSSARGGGATDLDLDPEAPPPDTEETDEMMDRPIRAVAASAWSP